MKTATPVTFEITGPALPYTVGTQIVITVGWLSPTSAGTGYLNVVITDGAGNTEAIPIGVLAPNAHDSVSYTCTGPAGSMSRVTVHEDTGHRWETLQGYSEFAVG